MNYVVRIVPGAYRDSVALMQLSTELATLPGVKRASLVMASNLPASQRVRQFIQSPYKQFDAGL